MVLVAVRGRLDRLLVGQRCSKKSRKMTLGSQGIVPKTGRVAALNKRQLILSSGDDEEGR
jgi:hypothetical protein